MENSSETCLDVRSLSSSRSSHGCSLEGSLDNSHGCSLEGSLESSHWFLLESPLVSSRASLEVCSKIHSEDCFLPARGLVRRVSQSCTLFPFTKFFPTGFFLVRFLTRQQKCYLFGSLSKSSLEASLEGWSEVFILEDWSEVFILEGWSEVYILESWIQMFHNLAPST